MLLQATGDDLVDLCASAARVRDAGLASAGRPGVVTYSRKVFIPLTRLCRDRCHYCTFVTVPGRLPAAYLSPDEILDIARQGAALGCKEALFTLGDRPEDRWPQAREWLDSARLRQHPGLLRAMAIRVLEETGLLPHLNPGVMSWEELQRLKPVAPSMGMMLETTSTAIFTEPGGAHFGSPDKDPAVRLRVLEDAGRSTIPFTTGILVGIGETVADRAESLFAIRRSARQYGAIQEVIVQNFLAKPDTAMRSAPDAGRDEYLATIAVARIVLGPAMRIQAPPNLSDAGRAGRSAGRRRRRLGRRLAADPRPRQPGTAVAAAGRAGRTRPRAAGFTLRGAAHRAPVLRADRRALARPAGAAARPGAGRPGDRAGRRRRCPAGPAVAGAGPGMGRPPAGSTCTPRSTPRAGAPRPAATSTTPTATGTCCGRRCRARPSRSLPACWTPTSRPRCGPPNGTRPGCRDAQALDLMQADGAELDALCALADDVRRDVVGDDVTYVVNRNINFTNVCYTGCRFCAFAQRRTDADAFTLSLDEVGRRADEAWAAGATEVCLQGGIDPDLPGTAYFDIAAEIRRRQPDLHIHAFSPMEIVNGASRTGIVDPGLAGQGQGGRAEFHSRAPPPRSSTTTSGGS